MKITVGQLRSVINEEITRVLKEADAPVDPAVVKLARGEGGVPLALREVIKSGDASVLEKWDDILIAVDSAKAEIAARKEEPTYFDRNANMQRRRYPGAVLRSEEDAAIETAQAKYDLKPGTKEHDLVATFVYHPKYVPPTADQVMGAMKFLADQAAATERKNKEKKDALAAAEDAGIDLSFLGSEYMTAQAAPYSKWAGEMEAYKEKERRTYDRIYKAWDPVTRTLDVMQLRDLLPKEELPELS